MPCHAMPRDTNQLLQSERQTVSNRKEAEIKIALRNEGAGSVSSLAYVATKAGHRMASVVTRPARLLTSESQIIG